MTLHMPDLKAARVTRRRFLGGVAAVAGRAEVSTGRIAESADRIARFRASLAG